jgi:myotubularin-related protein 6/7/8
MQDEKLIEAIFTSHLFADPESATAQAALVAGSNNTSTGNAATDRGNVIAIYGATTTNLIVDARPTTNAMANRAKGAGTENMEHYKGCKKVYLGVDNIHVMRDSLQKVTDALRASEPSLTFEVDHINTATEGLRHDNNGPRAASSDEAEALPLDHIMLKRSYWLRHISALLEGTAITTKNIHVNNSHVLIHCSDGWDRTSQLASLAEICLDPYYRTMKGFAVLVEKDWCSFGHRFWDRCGHASSEKYFSTAQGYGEDNSDDQNVGDATTPSGGFEPQAAANAFWGFTKQITANFQSSSDSHTSHGRGGAHLKETSPVFHQFLDCIWQIMRQYPSRFEFNEAWLLDLYDGLYECKYGTFLYNSEGERNGLSEVGMKPAASSRSTSIWDFMLDEGRRELYSNQLYDRNLDTDSKRSGADMGVLLPNSKDVGFWGRLFRKDGKEMNRLVEAEAEERKRQIEGVERQRQYDDSAVEATASSLGPAEVEGVTVGPVVQGGQDDPVLRNGVVEVSKTDRDGLTYRPYEPRSRPSQARPLHHLEGKSSSQIPIRLNRDVPVEESPLGAQEAAAKMKTMFLGWGAKFQDAYTIATSGPERPTPSSDDTSSFSSAPTRENSAIAKSGVTGQHAGLNNVASQGGRRSAAPSTYTPRSPPIRESNANPWAASAATRRNYNNLEGLPNELVPAVQGANLGHPDKAQQTKSKGEAGEGREGKVGADYDPLGVGNI